MMKKLNTNSNEEKLKELTYQHAKEIGTKFQELASSEISTNEVDNMNKVMEKAIQMNLEIDRLRKLINKINAGDSTVQPYMEFAQMYPVRDSMRMMRLLYRLSLGRQERKQEQLITFSKTISNLQQKAREQRYKERLDKMESKTMSMLVCTGVGVMVLLVLFVMNMMGT